MHTINIIRAKFGILGLGVNETVNGALSNCTISISDCGSDSSC